MADPNNDVNELNESMLDDIDYINELSGNLDDLGDTAEDYLHTMDRYQKSACRTKNLLRLVNKYL